MTYWLRLPALAAATLQLISANLWGAQSSHTPKPILYDGPPDDLFTRHYRPEVRAAIPFFGIQAEEPVAAAFRTAGFEPVKLSLLDPKYVEDADKSVRPYIIVADRHSAIAPG